MLPVAICVHSLYNRLLFSFIAEDKCPLGTKTHSTIPRSLFPFCKHIKYTGAALPNNINRTWDYARSYSIKSHQDLLFRNTSVAVCQDPASPPSNYDRCATLEARNLAQRRCGEAVSAVCEIEKQHIFTNTIFDTHSLTSAQIHTSIYIPTNTRDLTLKHYLTHITQVC